MAGVIVADTEGFARCLFCRAQIVRTGLTGRWQARHGIPGGEDICPENDTLDTRMREPVHLPMDDTVAPPDMTERYVD